MKNSSYYIAPVGDWTHDLPHTVHSKNRLVKKTTNLIGWPNIGCFNQYIG